MVNALRHLRFKHIGIDRRNIISLICIINTLRHLRFSHRANSSVGILHHNVSNALRHLRFKHTIISIKGHLYIIVVSNALRHLRLKHWERGGTSKTSLLWSTPYGSRVETRIWNVANSRTIKVINALQHLRFRHLPEPMSPEKPVIVWSTPYGIQGWNALLSAKLAESRINDQRLTASKVETRL